MYQKFIRVLFIIQFPLICLCHDDGGVGIRDVILSPKDFGGKYVKFNHRLVEMTTLIPWEEPLKESVKIALSNLNLSKDSILRAQYMGMKNQNPQNAFGDIVIMAKGKLKKLENESMSFEEIHDVCEFECQNNADKYLENVTALWMVERIRHRDNVRGYRYDLRFTIVPISNAKTNGVKRSNNLEERLRNQLKKTFILRDTDYPKYFQSIAPKSMRRADHLDRSQTSMHHHHHHHHPNHLLHHVSFPQAAKVYSSGERLNIGEFFMKPFSMNHKPPAPAPQPMNTKYYAPNVNNQRYPVRFPDSREAFKNTQYRIKPMREEEKQEVAAQNVVNFVDHRGAVELSKQQQQQQSKQQHSRPNPNNIFMHQQAIALPIIVPQMPMGLVHVAPYTIPLHLQLSTPSNQILYPQQQPDITTFRYPLPFINSQQAQQQQQSYVPAFSYIPSANKTSSKSNNDLKGFKGANEIKDFKESEVLHSGKSFSLPDPIYHTTTTFPITTTERPIKPTQYTPRGHNYATAASIQINSYDSNDFQPMDPPPYLISKNKKPQPISESKQHVTTEKSKFSSFKNHETRHRPSVKERISRPVTTIPPYISPIAFSSSEATYSSSSSSTSTSSSTYAPYTDFPRNHQYHDTNYDVIATRPNITKRTTTEKPILKWLPKKHRNKTLSSVTSYTAYPTRSTSTTTIAATANPFIVIEAITNAPATAAVAETIHSNIHPSIKASSTHAQVFRGRNRFYGNNRRNSSTKSTSSVTEKSTKASAALSSTVSNQTLKLLKRKITTTTTSTPPLLPIITTQQPTLSSLITTDSTQTTIFPTSFITSSPSYETIEPISFSTSASMQADNNEERMETTAAATAATYSPFYELISAGVETINTNSSNIQLYKAEADGEDENEKLKIDEIASSIINHAKSTENDEMK